jgi:voltage-gated potassium channel
MEDAHRTSTDQHDADVGRYLLLFGLLFASILVLGLLGPATDSGESSRLTNALITALSGAVLIAALRISSAKRSHQRFYFSLAVVVLAMLMAVIFFGSDSFIQHWFAIAWVLLVIATPVIVLKRVVVAGDVTSQTILGAVCVFLLIGIAFAYLIMAMDRSAAFFVQEVEPSEYIYFSFVTITSLGFGDLTPATDIARTTTIVFTVVGQLYLVMIFAKLVSVWRPKQRSNR